MVQQGTFKSVAMYLNRTYCCKLYNVYIFLYLFLSTLLLLLLYSSIEEDILCCLFYNETKHRILKKVQQRLVGQQ